MRSGANHHPRVQQKGQVSTTQENYLPLAQRRQIIALTLLVGLLLPFGASGQLTLSDTLLDADDVVLHEVREYTITLRNESEHPVDVYDVRREHSQHLPLIWSCRPLIPAGKQGTLKILYPFDQENTEEQIAVCTTKGIYFLKVKGSPQTPQLSKLHSKPGRAVSLYPKGKPVFEMADTRKEPKAPNAFNEDEFVHTSYYTNGTVSVIITKDKEGFHRQDFYPNGKIARKGAFIGSLQRQLETGEWQTWHANGQLQSVGNYKNGLKKGYHESFYAKGNLKDRTYYEVKKQKRRATTEFVIVPLTSLADWYEAYYPDGTKKMDYRSIKGGGISFAWFPNGQLNVMQFVKDGTTKIYKEYCWDGSLVRELDDFRMIAEHEGSDIPMDCNPYGEKPLLNIYYTLEQQYRRIGQFRVFLF